MPLLRESRLFDGEKEKDRMNGYLKTAAMVCLCVMMLMMTACNDDGVVDQPTNTAPSATTTAPVTTTTVAAENEEDREQAILDSIDKSKEYAQDGNFIEALAVLDTAEQLYGSDPRLDEQRKAVQVAEVLHDAEMYEEEQDYGKAIECIENSAQDVKEHPDVVQKLNVLKLTYKEYVLAQAEEAFETSGYEAAIELLNESLTYLADDKDIAAAIKRYEEYIPVIITQLTYTEGDDWALENQVKDTDGKIHDNVVSPQSIGWSNAHAVNVYRIDKKYSRLSGTWFQRYDFREEVKYGMGGTTYPSILEIYGDGRLLYAGEMKFDAAPVELDVDISGVTELTIDYLGGGSDGSYSGVADFAVQK